MQTGKNKSGSSHVWNTTRVVPWVINNGGRKRRGVRSRGGGGMTERGEVGGGRGWVGGGGLEVELCRWRGKKFLASTRETAYIFTLYKQKQFVANAFVCAGKTVKLNSAVRNF